MVHKLKLYAQACFVSSCLASLSTFHLSSPHMDMG